MAEIIVTGGAGLIGVNLMAALNQRGMDDIVVVDRLDHPAKARNLAACRYRELRDIDEFRSALRAGCIPPARTLFHLGACSSTTEANAAYLSDNNTRYTEELCQWALAHGTRFIYASSAATYGDGSRGYSDDDAVLPTLQPLNLYGESKQAFDLAARQAGWLQRIAGLKYFNVYGPGEEHKGEMRSVAHKAYCQIRETGELRLFKSYRRDFCDGEQRRDFVHVRDAVEVTLFFHDHPEVSGLFNCGTGRARTWLDLGHAVFAALGRAPRITFVEMPVAIREHYQYHTEADLTKLRAAGCRQAFVSLEDGVREYVQNYLNR